MANRSTAPLDDFTPVVAWDVATGISLFAADPAAVPKVAGPLRDRAVREAEVHSELRRILGDAYDRAFSPSGLDRVRAAVGRAGLDRVLRAVRAAAEARGAKLLRLPRLGFDSSGLPDDDLFVAWAYWAVTAAKFGPDSVPAPSGRYGGGSGSDAAAGQVGRSVRVRRRGPSRHHDAARRALTALRASALVAVLAS